MAEPLLQDESAYGWRYVGTKDELMTAGIVGNPALFADGSERTSRGIVRTKKAVLGGLKVSVTMRDGDGLGRYYVVFKDRPIADRDDILAAQERDWRRRQEKVEAEQYRASMAKLIASKGAVHKAAEEILENGGALIYAAFNVARSYSCRPWSFPVETVEQVQHHLQAIERLFSSGGFKLEPGKFVKGDDEFQRFMRTAQSEVPNG